MTREEAIKEVKDMVDGWQEAYAETVIKATPEIQALNILIKELEQEPCEDEMRVGNEIISDGTKAVILHINSWNDWECLCSTGVFTLKSETKKYWHKTGRDFPQIRELFKEV